MFSKIFHKANALVRRIKSRYARKQKSSIISATRLTDKAFLTLFDINSVKKFIEQDDIPSAKAALFEHYQNRKTPSWLKPPKTITDLRVNTETLNRDEFIALAESIQEYRFAPDGSMPRIVKNRIDWEHNPISSPEWLWRLNRHQWWPFLGLTYQLTQDERYAEAFVCQVTDWIQRNAPTFLKNEKSPTWRLMETGLRMYISWIPSFSMFYDSPQFSDDHKLTMLQSIYDHANFLYNCSTNRNHLLRETNGLIAVSIYFPEFIDAEKWRQEALNRFEREISMQLYSDGTHIEVSPGYQWLVVDELQRTYDLLTAGNLSLSTQNLGCWLEKMYTVLATVIRPDSTFPEINDGFMRWSYTRLAEAGKTFNRDDFIFVGTSGKEGAPPETTSVMLPDAGWVVMRSDWTKQARYLLFDTGPYGGPHGHEDKLSIEVYAFGQPFIVDSGSYTYEKTDPFRSYFVSTLAHNSVLVDGKSQIRRWNKSNLTPTNESRSHARWICRETFDYAVSTYEDGYADFHLKKPKEIHIIDDVVHIRRVIFVKPEYWVVIDEVQTQRPHDYQLLFHAAPGLNTQVMPDGRVSLDAGPSSSRLLIVPGEPQTLNVELITGSSNPIQGWFSIDHHKKAPSTAIVYERKQTMSTILTTLLYPTLHDCPENAISIRTFELEAGDGYAYVVQGEKTSDYIVISDDDMMKKIGAFQSREMVSVMRTGLGDVGPWNI